MKNIYIIGGPNGSGKTSLAVELMSTICPNYINSDNIAKGLNLTQLAPVSIQLRAGRIFSNAINSFLHEGISFGIETTLSGQTIFNQVRSWRGLGYTVRLIYLSLPTARDSYLRVMKRVSFGGHDVPEADIYRRFERCKENFERMKILVHSWAHYRNQDQLERLGISDNFDRDLQYKVEEALKEVFYSCS